MMQTIQPGQKEVSTTGRFAVHFSGEAWREFHPSIQRTSATPAEQLEHHRMKRYGPKRLCLGAAAVLLLAAAPLWAQRKLPPPPVEARPGKAAARIPQNLPPAREEHLQRWMESHSGMSLAEQQRALQNESGFRALPPQVQQNRLNTLARLYNMNPQQRTRILDRTEALERMTPSQRQQWRDAAERVHAIPQPRKRMIAGAILELRQLPPEQREAVLNSPAYSAQFSPDERQTLRTLLMAEPYPETRTPRPAYPPPPAP